MKGFEKFKCDYIENHLPHPRYGGLSHAEGSALKVAWQESAKHCKLSHDDIFEIGHADGRTQERKRIVEYILKIAEDETVDGMAALRAVAENILKGNYETEEADRIEKESK